MGRLDEKVALVTGGSRGFGRAICLAFAHEGARVAINYLQAAREAGEVRDRIARAGGQAGLYQADVADEAAVERMVKAVAGDFGRIDVLVNNSGVLVREMFGRIPVEGWRRMLAVNIDGVLYCTHHVLAVMKANRWGRIINITSQLERVGGPRFAVYSATKGAVHSFTRALAQEVGAFNITVNNIAPGGIVTDMNRSFYTPEVMQRRAGELPVRHLGTPEDVAAAAVFFAMEEANYLTGQTLYAAGGAVMH